MNIQEAITAYESGDFEKALKIFMPFAERGDPVAQTYLGEMYELGEGVKEDLQEALKWFRMAAEQGYVEAQYKLSLLYLGGGGIKRDAMEAAKWLSQAAEQGDDMARCELGDRYLEGLGVKKNIEEGMQLLLWVAEHGTDSNAVLYARWRLAELYREGKTVPQDGIEAVKWLHKVADSGEVSAQYDLGLMYFEGKEVKQDFAEAVKWFHKAAEAQHVSSYYRLGQMYYDGKGVQQDYAKAIQWYCKGVEANDGRSLAPLADMYNKGLVEGIVDSEVVKRFRRAVETGDRDLRLYLGLRKFDFRDYLSKFYLFRFTGIVILPFLAYCDWQLLRALGAMPIPRFRGLIVIAAIISGQYLGYWISTNITYQVNRYFRITGIPFPLIAWEPKALGSNEWRSFDLLRPFTIFLNSLCVTLVLIAVLTTLAILICSILL
jgi:TPR repeat protein